jgi:hypothetical protein
MWRSCDEPQLGSMQESHLVRELYKKSRSAIYRIIEKYHADKVGNLVEEGSVKLPRFKTKRSLKR